MSELVITLAFVAACSALWRAIADHRKLRHTLDQMNNTIAQANKLIQRRGQLADELAHEIKNPLTAILCSAEALDLLVGPNLETTHRKCLTYIRDYGDNLLRLVSDFLDLSRIEGGKVTPELKSTNVQSLVTSVAGLLESVAHRKGIAMNVAAEEDGLRAIVDGKLLKQVIFNLAHNAVKFTPPGGKIDIRIVSESEFISISVGDSGPGIESSRISMLFDPYTSFGSDGGAGLGLTVSKSLVELCGGTLEVDSEVGVGTTFTVHIPRDENSKQIPRAPSRAHYVTGKPLMGRAFLLVDRDEGSRGALAHLIQAWGGMVDQVGQASEAIEALSAKKYAAVMVDKTQDGLKCHEFSKMVREKFDKDSVTLILTSNDEISDETMKTSGADRWIEKPLNGNALLRTLTNDEDTVLLN